VRDSQTRQVKDRDVLALLQRTDTLLFLPGSAFRYGDSGYAILALVVETVSGECFARFLHDRIFARAGMASTVAYEPGISVVPHRALGYSPAPDRISPVRSEPHYRRPRRWRHLLLGATSPRGTARSTSIGSSTPGCSG
jgi:CubicO group peptidase (beta-lactamase class C family)